MIRIGVLPLSLLFAIGARTAPIENNDGFWRDWNDATFARAAAENKFVVVSLQSWWCRWCHVMNRETWSNAEVRGVLKDKFGFIVPASPEAQLLRKPVKQRENNVTAVRMFSLLSSYTGESRYREIAEAGMGYLSSPPILDAFGFLPDVLLAEDELRNEPVHVTIVGAKDDVRSAALYKGALAYPLPNKRAEWWDKREGKLANIDVDYPDYPDGPAAFACTSTFCSYPVTEPREIAAQLDG